MSGSAIRTSRPTLCTCKAPESMRRRTVRDDTFKSSAVSSIVRSLVRGRPGVAVPAVRDADLEVGRRGGLE
jgi:hypothetical protein